MLEVAGVQLVNAPYLYLLAGVPLLWVLWRTTLRRRVRFRQELYQPDIDHAKFRRTSSLGATAGKALRYSGLTLIVAMLIVSLTRPRIQREQIQEDLVGIDMVMLLDVSHSMRAEDIVPSRLEKAKEVIRDFIVRKSDGDRIALVSFAETSLILSYLTSDPENLIFYMDFLQPQFGTNIGRAVKAGLTVYEREAERRAQEARVDEPRQHRFIVLVSDGEDHGEELDEALAQAAAGNIRIHCIGVGSRRPVVIPVALQQDGLRKYLLDRQGNQVHTQFREHSLRDVAQRTGGRFYRAVAGHQMAQAFDEILRREKQIADVRITMHYEDLYPWLLLGSLGLFLLLAVFVPE